MPLSQEHILSYAGLRIPKNINRDVKQVTLTDVKISERSDGFKEYAVGKITVI